MIQKIPLFYLLLLFILQAGILCPLDTAAQTEDKVRNNNLFRTGKWGLEANWMSGRFLKHGVEYLPKPPAEGFELNYFMKTLGEKPWHKGMNYPEIGVTLTYYWFPDYKVFGSAISLMSYGKFYMVRSKIANFYMRIGGGYGILTKVYNPVTNPVNQFISLPVNLAVQLRTGLEWKINEYIQLNTAISFNHFSNSAMKLPNYGINIPSGTLGIRFFPHPKELGYLCEHSRNFKKNELIWKYSIGIMQLHSFYPKQIGYSYNNPAPPTHAYGAPGGLLAYGRYINYNIKFYGGVSFEYFPAIHDYLESNDIHTRYSPTFEAAIPSALLGSELILGRLSMYYSAGAYLWKNTAAVTPVYFKIGMNLYLYELRMRRGTTFFFGNGVKAHTNVAQYNEFSVGGTL